MMRRLVLAAAVLLLLIPTIIFAQDDATLEFYGTIQSANATALVVNGQVVDISGAKIESPLVRGMTVHVSAAYAEDGSLTAESVEPVSPGQIPGIVVISGEITDLTESAIRIRGHIIGMTNAVVSGTLRFGNGASATVYAVENGPDNWEALVVVADGGIPAFTQVGVPNATPEVGAPNATPEVNAPNATPEVSSPNATPEVGAPNATPEVNAPNATPEVGAPNATPEINAPNATPEVNAPNATPEVSSPNATPEVGAPNATPEAEAAGGESFVIEGTLTAIGSRAVIVDGKRYDISTARRDGTLVVGARVRLELRALAGQPAILDEIKVIGGSDDSSDGNSGSSGSNSGKGSNNSGGGSSNSGKGGGSDG